MDKLEILRKLDKTHFFKTYVPSLKTNGKPEALGSCPFHNDKNPSLSVNIESGLFRCFACDVKGDIFTFYQKLKGVDFPTALKEIGDMAGITDVSVKSKVVATFMYHDSGGNLLYRKERLEPGRHGRKKEFVFKHQVNGKWVLGRGCDAVLYRLPAIVRSEGCFITEGEAKADFLLNWGLPATCLDSGANSPLRDDCLQLLGKMEKVIILPDNDKPGRSYATRIADALHGKVKELKIVELPGLQEKADILDWAKIPGNTKARLIELIGNAPVWKSTLIEDARIKAVDDLPREIEENNNYDQLVKKFGEPYYLNNDGTLSAINQAFWAGLNNSEHVQIYEPDELLFYRYNENTGLYAVVSEDLIKQEISKRMLEVSREKGVSGLETKRTNANLTHIARHLLGISEKRNAFKYKDKIVHLANGIIKFKNGGEADWVAFSPDFYSRNQSPITFEKSAKCDRFLNELLYPAVNPADALLIQKYFGLCLLGRNLIQRFLILDGEGGRGKTQIALIAQHLIGRENATQLRTRHLDERFEMYRFLKKTLLVGVDVPGDFLSDKGACVLKGLVGGDFFDAEQKGGTGCFQIQGDFCVLITSNSRLQLRIDGDLSAWKRRLLIVRFEAPPPKKKIPDLAHLLIKEEGSGILNWALHGLYLLLKDIEAIGDIQLENSQHNIVDALLAESDSLRYFLNDCVERDEAKDLATSEIVESYAEYCADRGWNAKPLTVVHKELESSMLSLFGTSKAQSISRDGKSVRGFRRVQLKTRK